MMLLGCTSVVSPKALCCGPPFMVFPWDCSPVALHRKSSPMILCFIACSAEALTLWGSLLLGSPTLGCLVSCILGWILGYGVSRAMDEISFTAAL